MAKWVVTHIGRSTIQECVEDAAPQESEPEDLLPCPFCGDTDYLRNSHITGGIFCENCGCDGPSSPFWDGNWNTRATPAAQSGASDDPA